MKETYTMKYRQPGQIFWRKIKNVKATRFEPGAFWAFITEDDAIHYASKDAEVYFPPERQAIITFQMGKEVGQPIQRV